MRLPLLATTLAAFALSTGVACVTTPEFRALEREVSRLKGGGGGGVDAGGGDVRVAELGSELEELRGEIAELRGMLEEVRHTANLALEAQPTSGGARPGASVPGATQGLERSTRVERGDPDRPVAQARTVPDNRSTDYDEPGSGGGGGLSTEVRAYEEAFRLYRSGDFAAAIDRFDGFIQNHPSSDYADNAMFWMGECHFKLGDHEQAALVFNDVVKRFPDGNKVPDALYREGAALIEIGVRTRQEAKYGAAARQIFEQILKDHPDSERVPEARRQLEKLGR